MFKSVNDFLKKVAIVHSCDIYDGVTVGDKNKADLMQSLDSPCRGPGIIKFTNWNYPRGNPGISCTIVTIVPTKMLQNLSLKPQFHTPMLHFVG